MRKELQQIGFTLAELIVVLLLITVLAAVALPRFFDLNSYRNHAAYDEVAAALRYAQKLAVASGCEVQVVFTPNTYALQQHDTDCTGGPFTTLTDHPINDGIVDGVALAAAPSTFSFDAMGRSSSGATITVGTETIQVIAETGTVDAP